MIMGYASSQAPGVVKLSEGRVSREQSRDFRWDRGTGGKDALSSRLHGKEKPELVKGLITNMGKGLEGKWAGKCSIPGVAKGERLN